MKKLAGIVIIVLIAAGFVAVRVVRARQKNEASPVGAISPLVTVAIVTEGRIARTRHALGTVIGANEAELAPRITGQVIEVPVREGARIRRGQVLVRLDDRELEDAVGRAEAALAAARAGLAAAEVAAKTQVAVTARDRTLFEAGALSREALERSAALEAAAAARLASARAAVEQAERQLDQARVRSGYATLTAPFDGVVATRLADPGDLAVPGHPLMRLVARGGLRVRAALPGEDLPLLHAGTPVHLAGASSRLAGAVSRVFPSLDHDRLAVFEIDLAEAPPEFAPGASVGVDVEVAAARGLVVPADALLTSARGTFVFAIRDGRIAVVPVRVPARSDRDAVVEGVLRAGESVAVGRPARLMRLADGMKVRLATGTPAVPR